MSRFVDGCRTTGRRVLNAGKARLQITRSPGFPLP